MKRSYFMLIIRLKVLVFAFFKDCSTSRLFLTITKGPSGIEDVREDLSEVERFSFSDLAITGSVQTGEAPV